MNNPIIETTSVNNDNVFIALAAASTDSPR